MGKEGKLLAAYLVAGSNDLKRDTAISHMKGRQDQSLAAFNLDEIHAEAGMDAEALRMSLESMPMGDAFRLVIVYEADRLPKAALDMLVSYLKAPNPSCVLMLVVGDVQKSGAFMRSKLVGAVKAQGASAVVDCTPPKAWQVPDLLVRTVAPRLGVRLDRDGAEELVKRSGTSMRLLQTEISQLAGLAAEPGHIRRGDVEAHIARTAEVTPWEFADAVSARDAASALSLLGQMHLGSYLGILSYLTDRMRELICAKCLDTRGDAGSLAKELGRQSWQVKNHIGWSRRFTEEELVACLRACASCDRALKSGADQQTAMVELVLGICGKTSLVGAIR